MAAWAVRKRHPAPAQERAERRPQCMHVERAAPLVALRDAGRLQVAVEDSYQAGRHVEDGASPGGSAAGIGSPRRRASAWSAASLSASQARRSSARSAPDDDAVALRGSSRRRRRVRREARGRRAGVERRSGSPARSSAARSAPASCRSGPAPGRALRAVPALRGGRWRRLPPSACPGARSGLRAGGGGGPRRAVAPARLRSSPGGGGGGRRLRSPSAPP